MEPPVLNVELSIAHINIASLRHKVHDIHKNTAWSWNTRYVSQRDMAG